MDEMDNTEKIYLATVSLIIITVLFFASNKLH